MGGSVGIDCCRVRRREARRYLCETSRFYRSDRGIEGRKIRWADIGADDLPYDCCASVLEIMMDECELPKDTRDS